MNRIYPKEKQISEIRGKVNNAEDYFKEPEGAQQANQNAFESKEYQEALAKTSNTKLPSSR